MSVNRQVSKGLMAPSTALAKLKKPLVRTAGPVRRVSLEIPVELWKKAKMAAFEGNESLRDLILRGLESELTRPRRKQ